MQCLARSGSAIVVASGQITTFQGAPLQVEFFSSAHSQFVVRWVFEQDPSISDVAVHLAIDETVFQLTCVNFDKADGRGTGKPLQLLDKDGRRYWLHFRIFLYGNTADRTVHYTVYEEQISSAD